MSYVYKITARYIETLLNAQVARTIQGDWWCYYFSFSFLWCNDNQMLSLVKLVQGNTLGLSVWAAVGCCCSNVWLTTLPASRLSTGTVVLRLFSDCCLPRSVHVQCSCYLQSTAA